MTDDNAAMVLALRVNRQAVCTLFGRLDPPMVPTPGRTPGGTSA
jgi:hypothetical protein